MALNQITGYERFLPGVIDKIYEKESIFGNLFKNPDVKLVSMVLEQQNSFH